MPLAALVVLVVGMIQQESLACDSAFAAAPAYAPMSTGPVFVDRAEIGDILRQEFSDVPVAENGRGPVVWIGTDRAGRIMGVRIERSSGDALVDSVAVRAVRRFRYNPATYNGSPVCSWVMMGIPLPEARPVEAEPDAAARSSPPPPTDSERRLVVGEVARFDATPLAPEGSSRGCHALVVCTNDCPYCAELADTRPPDARWLVIAPGLADAKSFASAHAIPLERVDWVRASETGLADLGLTGTPTVVVLDERGVVRDIRLGPTTSREYAESICSRPLP